MSDNSLSLSIDLINMHMESINDPFQIIEKITENNYNANNNDFAFIDSPILNQNYSIAK
jgi:hypothetical protein